MARRPPSVPVDNRIHLAPIAQLDRASGYEPGGRTFESCWAHQPSLPVTRRLPTVALAEVGWSFESRASVGKPSACVPRLVTPQHASISIRLASLDVLSASRAGAGPSNHESFGWHLHLMRAVEAAIVEPGAVTFPDTLAAVPAAA